MPTKPTPLPPGVIKSDLSYPRGDAPLALETRPDRYGPISLTLHHTERFGWCIATLHISNPSRRQRAAGNGTARTYAINLDGQLVRVGLGPHVTRTITVYVKESRLPQLQHLINLRDKGAVAANEKRDTISTRRARGVGRVWGF